MVHGNRHLKNLARELSASNQTSYAKELDGLNKSILEERNNIPKAFESWLPVFDSLGYGWKCEVVNDSTTTEEHIAIFYLNGNEKYGIIPAIALADSVAKGHNESLRYLPKDFGGSDLVILFEDTACTTPIVTRGKTTTEFAKAVAKWANKISFEVLEGEMPDYYRDKPEVWDAGVDVTPEDGIIWDSSIIQKDFSKGGEYLESSDPSWQKTEAFSWSKSEQH